MNKSKAVKGFDCVEMKHKTQERIQRETKGMTPRQKVSYFYIQANSGEVGEWWRSLGKQTANAA